MAFIERRAPKTWRARYRGPDRKERSKTFPRRVEAERFLASVEADKIRGNWIDPSFGRTTFADWLDQWWPTTVGLRPSSRARDESYIKNHVLPRFGPYPLASLTQLDVRKWVAELTAEDLAPATVRLIYQNFAKVIQGAIDAGLLAFTPCRNISLPQIERRDMRFLTPEQVAFLADTIHPRYRALVLLGAYGGLRRGELFGLRRHRTDPLRARVEVKETLIEVRGHLTFGPPKTRAGYRTVTIPRNVANELMLHMERFSKNHNDLLFQAPEGGPVRPSLFRKRYWQPAVKAAGIEPFRMHDLRHTAVSFWIAGGAHVRHIQALAGHTSAAVVLDRYGHILPSADEQLRDNLDAMFVASFEPPMRVAPVSVLQRSGEPE